MFSRSPSGSALPADQQSVVPTVRGLPWWGAVLLATVVTFFGALIDSAPSGELGRVFKIVFIIGCVLAALAVRRRAMFTAAVQPPLIAFVTGLITLYLEAGDAASDKKTLILKIVLPIATSFPWMLIAFVLSLAVVLARLFLTGPPSKRPFGGFGGFGAKTAARKPVRETQKSKTQTSKPQKPKIQKAKTQRPKTQGSQPQGATSSKSQSSKSQSPKSQSPKSTAKKSAAPTSTSGDSKRTAAAAPPKKAPADQPGANAPSKMAPPTPTRRPRPRPAAEPASSSDRDAAQREPVRRPRRTNPAEAPAPRSAVRPNPAPADAAAAPTERQTKRPDRRRAQPEKIPARPRRTAGQQLRERGAIEDLTAGLDD